MSLGNASYEQSQSALKHLFCMSKYVMQADFFENLKQFTKGILWLVADKIFKGNVAIVGMWFNMYKRISELMMKEEGDDFIFVCLFWLLSGISWQDLKMLWMHIFSVSTGRRIALCFALLKAKVTRWGGTVIKSGMFMPTHTTLLFARFLLLHIIHSQIHAHFWRRR